MALLYVNQPLDMSSETVVVGTFGRTDLGFGNPSVIARGDGLRSVTYSGSFTYENDRIAGRLESVVVTESGKLKYEIANADVSARAFLTQAAASNFLGAMEIALGRDGVALGSDGADDLYLFNGDDVGFGGHGDDAISGGRGGDTIDGEGGTDRLNGGRGDDAVYGGSGRDQLLGDRGEDDLRGEGGADRLFGGAGEDWIEGGRGADALRGGQDADVFVYATARDSTARSFDTIVGFVASEDRIDLGAFDGRPGTGRDDALRFVGEDAFSGDRPEVRFDGASLRIDLDGTVAATCA